jgi:uncharacterized protein (TIGR03437 family)
MSMDVIRWAVTDPVVTIGGAVATVTFAGLAPGIVGVNQINIIVPDDVSLGDAVPLSVTVGANADNAARIAIAH